MSESETLARIIARRQETAEIVALDLAAADGSALPGFAAGAHIDVALDEPSLVRQYSLYALPCPRGIYRIGVLNDPASRGGSQAMHRLEVGALLRISAPRNHFPLAPGTHETLLLAGGIGVTPLLCMAEQLAAEGAAFQLHYCARAPSRAAFLDLLRDAPYSGRIALHFDDGAEEQKLDVDAVLAVATPGTHLYVCGPAGFMAWVADAADRAAWPAERLHREYFKADDSQITAPNRPFRIRLGGSGRSFDIPADRSIVAVLHEAGVTVPVSCESGVCGTCLTRVLAGEPEHRDFYLTDEEKAQGGQMLPCCSRARSELLVLDL